MITLEKSISFSKVRLSSKQKSDRQTKAAGVRVPRISRMMALAIRFDDLLRRGVIKDQAELAQLGYVSRARVTQIMDLLYLAPAIQEEILHLPTFLNKKATITERQIRPITLILNWQEQKKAWLSIQHMTS